MRAWTLPRAIATVVALSAGGGATVFMARLVPREPLLVVLAALFLVCGVGLGIVIGSAMTSRSPATTALAPKTSPPHQPASETLGLSQDLFHLAFEQAAIGMAWLRPDGNWARVNHAWCALLGYSPKDMLSLGLPDITHADDLATEREFMEQLVQGERATFEVEQRCRHQDGHPIWVQAHVALVVDEDSQPLYFIKQVQDISERTRAQQALAQRADQLAAANRRLEAERIQREKLEAELRLGQKLEAIGQLAAGIAHEINTPIQFIGDSAHYLQQATGDVLTALDACLRMSQRSNSEQLELVAQLREALVQADVDFARQEIPAALERIFDGVGRVSTIVQAMKEFAHPTGRAIEAADLSRLIGNALIVSRNEYKRVAHVELDLGELPPVPCHIGELGQVLLNLIVNGAHAIAARVGTTAERGRIGIRAWVEADEAVIEVSDTGTGMPEAIRHRIFEPFFTTKPPGQGTGQGLAIARSIIVDRHHGKLSFESTEGRGTTFTIRLPLNPPGQAESEVAA